MLDLMLEGQIVSGLWDDTIFPFFKDILRTGADFLGDGDKMGNFLDGAMDTAITTLSVMVPELAPVIMALKGVTKQEVKDLAEGARKAVREWTVSGDYPNDSYGYAVTKHLQSNVPEILNSYGSLSKTILSKSE